MHRFRIPAILNLLALLLLCAACDDDGPGCPPDTVTPTLANLWPHEDGRGWTFDAVQTSREDSTAVLATPGTTVLPTFAEVRALLAQPLAGADVDTAETVYSLLFDGEITTMSGVTAQRLVATLDRQKIGAPADPRDGLLARIRPAADGFARIGPPVLLTGYAFAYEDSGYYGYGDLHTGHSWTYLAGGVAPGTTFELPLFVGMDDDVLLQGRVWSHHAVTVMGERTCNAVEVLYLIDLGENIVSDENGEALGAYRSYICGSVVYVPEVGPVFSHERSRIILRTAYQPEGDVFIDLDMVLTLTGTD